MDELSVKRWSGDRSESVVQSILPKWIRTQLKLKLRCGFYAKFIAAVALVNSLTNVHQCWLQGHSITQVMLMLNRNESNANKRLPITYSLWALNPSGVFHANWAPRNKMLGIKFSMVYSCSTFMCSTCSCSWLYFQNCNITSHISRCCCVLSNWI